MRQRQIDLRYLPINELVLSAVFVVCGHKNAALIKAWVKK